MAVDLTMVQGDTIALDFTIVDSSGDAIDITGASIRWQMSRSVRAAAILEKSIGDGITVTSAPAGTFTVLLEPEETIDLTGTFYYEVEIIDASGNVSTPRSGSISIIPGLIRP